MSPVSRGFRHFRRVIRQCQIPSFDLRHGMDDRHRFHCDFHHDHRHGFHRAQRLAIDQSPGLACWRIRRRRVSATLIASPLGRRLA